MQSVLLPHQERVLSELDRQTEPSGEKRVWTWRIAEPLGMETKAVSRIFRHLARRGYAELHKSCFDECTGQIVWAGYSITDEGRALVKQGLDESND